MSEPLRTEGPFTARVIEVDAPDDPLRGLGPQVIPQVIETERTEPIVPTEPAMLPVVTREAPRRRDRVITFGIAGVAVFFVGWLAVDAAGWVAAAFERSAALGALAATAVNREEASNGRSD